MRVGPAMTRSSQYARWRRGQRGLLRNQVLPVRDAGGSVRQMAGPAPTDPSAPARYTCEQYLGLVADGVLTPDDDVELLEGVIVAMSPSNLPHEAGLRRVSLELFRAVGERAVIHVQLPLAAGPYSLPEPDVAVVPGTIADYDHHRPTAALLVVEVSDTSLKQDRLTKGGIYAAAGFPEYWIVNLVDDCIEVRTAPAPGERRYANVRIARRGELLELTQLPGATIRVDDLLPAPLQ